MINLIDPLTVHPTSDSDHGINFEKRLPKRIIRAIKANHSRNRSLITFYKLVVLSNLFQIDLKSFLKTKSKLIKLDHNSLNRFKIFSQKRNLCLNSPEIPSGCAALFDRMSTEILHDLCRI